MTSLRERHATSEPPQPLSRELQRARIAIDGHQMGPRIALQQRLRVPAQPYRRIDKRSVFAIGAEVIDNRL